MKNLEMMLYGIVQIIDGATKIFTLGFCSPRLSLNFTRWLAYWRLNRLKSKEKGEDYGYYD